jgi:hypothetical protein
MKILLATSFILFFTSLTVSAQTYRWTDAQGVLHFTDSLESVPARYQNKVVTGSDITIRDPKILEEVKQQEERARQEEVSRPRIQPTPDFMPPPAPIVANPAKPASDDLPPGRTKSQRIRDNIERRQSESD